MGRSAEFGFRSPSGCHGSGDGWCIPYVKLRIERMAGRLSNLPIMRLCRQFLFASNLLYDLSQLWILDFIEQVGWEAPFPFPPKLPPAWTEGCSYPLLMHSSLAYWARCPQMHGQVTPRKSRW